MELISWLSKERPAPTWTALYLCVHFERGPWELRSIFFFLILSFICIARESWRTMCHCLKCVSTNKGTKPVSSELVLGRPEFVGFTSKDAWHPLTHQHLWQSCCLEPWHNHFNYRNKISQTFQTRIFFLILILFCMLLFHLPRSATVTWNHLSKCSFLHYSRVHTVK